jgi:LuxR family maltose regulon positive regulatory protein
MPLLENVRWFSPRLLSLLEKLPLHTTIIEAPSGYGKTMAGAYLLNEALPAGARKIWHACLDERAPAAWRHFCAAVRKIDETAANSLLSLGPPDKDTTRDAADILCDAACDEETWFFIDDLQNLSAEIDIGAWGGFWRRRDEKLHVVAMTRYFGDAALRGYPGAAWLGFADLALDAGEARGFFAAHGIAIGKKQADIAHEFTHGCAQGLWLQAGRYRETGEFCRLDDEDSYDEIIKLTAWKGLSKPEQDFLLRVSPFESYTMEQAAFLLGLAPGSAEPLPRCAVEASGMEPLVRHIQAEPSYNPHIRVLGFLRREVSRMAELRAEVLSRAAEWCVESGTPEDGVVFFCMNGDYDRALSVDILGREISPPKHSGMTCEEITVAVAQNASREAKLRHPVHFLKHVFNLLDVGRSDVFAELLVEFGEIIETSGLPEGEKRRLRGELTLLSSFGEYNDIMKMASLMKRAHELTGGRPSLIEMNDTWTFGNASVLFMYHSEPGRLDEELSEMKEGCGHYFTLTGGHGMGGDTLMEAEALFNRGDILAAEIAARKSLREAEKRKQQSVCIGSALLIARAAVMRGDADEVAGMREKMADYPRQSGLKSDRQEMDMADSWIMAELGRPGDMAAWIRAGEAEGKLKLIQALPYAQVLYGKYLLALFASGGNRERNMKTWLGLSDGALQLAGEMRSVMAGIYCNVLTARAWLGLGERGTAAASLDSALSLALPDRLIMPFAEHYSEISSVLSENTQLARQPSCLKEIEALAERIQNGKEAYKSADIPFGLTEKEYKMARMAANSLHNREIGDMLGLSEGTVKQYLNTIYHKIGSRGRAALKNIFGKTDSIRRELP